MRRILFIAHTAIALGLLYTGYAGYLNPQTFGIVALGGYALPPFLLLTAASLAVAAFTYKRHLLIPFVALLAAYWPVTLYCPYHSAQEAPEEALTVLSYNTHHWGMGDSESRSESDGDRGMTVAEYLAASNADIICLQESPLTGKAKGNIDTIVGARYQYKDTVTCANKMQLTIFSHFPIKRKEAIAYESVGNGSAAFWLDVRGREVIVINNHLQSTGLSIEERNKFSEMVHGRNDTIKSISKTIIGKLLDATRIRVPQAKTVAAFVRAHANGGDRRPIIVCGDFNDIPHSYVHNTMAKGLTDCYRETATGPGYSFARYGMRVRIDNILCTPDIKPYNFRVDHSIAASDHYPIIGQVTLPQ